MIGSTAFTRHLRTCKEGRINNDYLINNINPRFGIKDVEKIKFVEIQNNVKIFILDKDNLSWKNLLVLLSGR